MTAPPTFVPGYLGTVTLDEQPLVAGNVVSLTRTKNSLRKNVFGQKSAYALPGQGIASFSAQGHVTSEELPLLEEMRAKPYTTFALQVGEAGTVTDAGLYDGDIVWDSFEVSANADGEFDWSLQASISGEADYTPPASS